MFADLDRTKIEDGAFAGKELEICYVKNPVDAFFAQIQGSTRVKLDNGKLLRLNYIASNGKPYTPVGKFLIDRGIVSKEEMSMDKIRDCMEANPDEGKDLRRKNRSFVFFQETPLGAHDECIGAQGVPLTPGRSLAVDKRIHVYGTPIWIDAELPIESEKPETKFRHLLFAQDTGSAIVGPARADIYFGHGEEISHIAGRIKQNGQFVMLVPQKRGYQWHGGRHKCPASEAPAGDDCDSGCPVDHGNNVQRNGARCPSGAPDIMSSGDGKRRRVLSAEERVLWTTVTKSIAPLRESSAVRR